MTENYIVIHGSFSSSYNNWFPWIHETLTKQNKNIIVPSFPSGLEYQNYTNWSKVLNSYKDCGLINSNTTIIAHSIGSIFTIKYLLTSKIKIKKLISIAGFNNYLGGAEEYDQVNSSFFLENTTQIKEYVDKVVCIYSDNDPYLPKEVLEDFAQTLTEEPIIIPNGGHLNSESGYIKFERILEFI